MEHLYLFIIIGMVAMVTGDMCTVDSNNHCLCKVNTSTIDVSKILKFPISVKDGGFTYKINLCKPFNCNPQHTAECGCQSGGEKDGKPVVFSLGSFATAKWTVHSLSPLQFSIQYTGGDISQGHDGNKHARSAVFGFKYNKVSSDSLVYTKQDPNKLVYTFTIAGSHVKTVSPSSGGKSPPVGIVGLVLILLLLVAVILYLILGSVYMYNKRGARGVEVIPNVVLWREFALLVKDGVVFTFGPLVRKVRGGYSYEKI